MNEILYCIEDQDGNVIAKDLTMDVAMILARALFDTYFNEEDISYTVKRQKEDIPQPSPSTRLYAVSQTSESGETYYRDFKNCAWQKGLDECCLYSDKQFVKILAEKNWKGGYKILTFDLNLRKIE